MSLRLRHFVASALLLCASAAFPADQPAHPLEPLTKSELTSVVRILTDEGRINEDARFPLITLHEPRKEDVARFRAGDALPRQAFVTVYDLKQNRTIEAVVDLSARKTAEWKILEKVQPPVLIEEYERAAAAVRTDPRWQKAMTRRGITELAKVQLDSWAGGSQVVPGHEGARLLRVLSYNRGDGVNAYGRPIEGVLGVVEMKSRKVIEFVDREPLPVPANKSDPFDPETLGPPRAAFKPLKVSQPDGPGFEIRGGEVRWQNWRFRPVMHPREGLVLHAVGWQDGDRVRPVMHRASLAEMLVPYGDPDTGWSWRNAFDQGEYGLGQFANTLRAGEDVPENAVLLSAVHASESGTPVERKDVIALYEQDGGILWRHMDWETQRVVTRRARQLVVHYFFTVGNYDYGLKWTFHLDGTIEAQVELGGAMQVKGAPDMTCTACRQKTDANGRVSGSGPDRYGMLVDRNIVAPNHQHYFCFRLDLDIDGPRNTVAELDVRPEAAGEKNPASNAFFVEQTRIASEAAGRRDANPATHRTWRIFNAGETSPLGHFSGYLLDAGPSPTSLLLPDAAVRKRAGFIQHPLWITRQHPAELHPAGDYPNQSAGGDGLPRWAGSGESDESLANEDVVLWHVLGTTHTPRVEDWPIMSTARVGFRLLPDGFFPRNPTLDVPAKK